VETQAQRPALLDLMLGGHPSLLDVLDQIVEHPHRAMEVDTPVVELEELTEPDTEGFLKLVTDPSHLAPADGRPTHFTHGGRNYHFTHVVDRRRRITFDTIPNRFVRHFLERFRRVLKQGSAAATDDGARVRRRIQALLGSSFLADVGKVHRVSVDHVVLRKDPNYRRILEASIALGRLA